MYRRLRRFNKKNASAVGEAQAPYISFNCHSSESSLNQQDRTMLPDDETKYFVQVCAIDPGIKNCCIRIERRTFSKEGGVLERVETILQVRFDFTTLKIESLLPITTAAITVAASPSYHDNFINMFDLVIKPISESHYILVESQMSINTESMRMAQAIITYLMLKTQNIPPYPRIIEIDPKFKTSVALGAPPMRKKADRKKWAVEKATAILTEHSDTSTLQFLKKVRKKDDHGDVVCYTTAWFMHLLSVQPQPTPVG
jgi:hypothetical protein